MEFKLTQVRLLVTEYAACRAFYRDTLGFAVKYEDADYVSFQTQNATLSIYKRPLMAEVVGASDRPVEAECQDRVVVFLEVDDVDQTVAELRAKGVTIIQGPTDWPTWGARNAHFRDPDGTLIEISQWLT